MASVHTSHSESRCYLEFSYDSSVDESQLEFAGARPTSKHAKVSRWVIEASACQGEDRVWGIRSASSCDPIVSAQAIEKFFSTHSNAEMAGDPDVVRDLSKMVEIILARSEVTGLTELNTEAALLGLTSTEHQGKVAEAPTDTALVVG